LNVDDIYFGYLNFCLHNELNFELQTLTTRFEMDFFHILQHQMSFLALFLRGVCTRARV